jgi:hypothetical protein
MAGSNPRLGCPPLSNTSRNYHAGKAHTNRVVPDVRVAIAEPKVHDAAPDLGWARPLADASRAAIARGEGLPVDGHPRAPAALTVVRAIGGRSRAR